jgi:O-succinylbenzoic acid--CoA ligase
VPAPDAAILAPLADPTAPSRPLHALAVTGTEVADALASTWAAGAAAVVLPARATPRERARLLELLRPDTIVHRGADATLVRNRLPDGVPVAGEVAVLVTTSGSTGAPKAVALPHTALAASVAGSLARLGARPGERWGLALPTQHVAGLSVLLRAQALGTRAVPAADTAAVADLEVQHIALVPTQLADLLAQGAPVDRFTTILLGGARPEPALLTRAAEAGARVVVSYGLTESVGGCVYDGVPLDGVEVACTATGRVRLRGPVLLHGYRTLAADRQVRDVPGLDADGWFTTSDVGRIEQGRLTVTGRADDVLVSGGQNVPLAAVRDALVSHPAVAEAAVTAVDDERWGQVPAAVVVATDPERPPTLDGLRTYVKQQAPAAYAPRHLVVVPALPRDELGKVTRAALDRLVAGLSSG